jgi:hypothetical protein
MTFDQFASAVTTDATLRVARPSPSPIQIARIVFGCMSKRLETARGMGESSGRFAKE